MVHSWSQILTSLLFFAQNFISFALYSFTYRKGYFTEHVLIDKLRKISSILLQHAAIYFKLMLQIFNYFTEQSRTTFYPYITNTLYVSLLCDSSKRNFANIIVMQVQKIKFQLELRAVEKLVFLREFFLIISQSRLLNRDYITFNSNRAGSNLVN